MRHGYEPLPRVRPRRQKGRGTIRSPGSAHGEQVVTPAPSTCLPWPWRYTTDAAHDHLDLRTLDGGAVMQAAVQIGGSSARPNEGFYRVGDQLADCR
jgi:hypothetical protein